MLSATFSVSLNITLLVPSILFEKLQKLFYAGQIKRKVNFDKLSLEFKSVTIAAHKERPTLKHGQIHA